MTTIVGVTEAFWLTCNKSVTPGAIKALLPGAILRQFHTILLGRSTPIIVL